MEKEPVAAARPAGARGGFGVRAVALGGLAAALTAALGAVYVPLPMSPVPVTGQTLGVMLAGLALGGRLGFWSQLAFVGLVAAGAPLLAGGRGGLGIFLGPTGGYVAAFPLAAWVIGRLAGRSTSVPRLLGAALVGGVVVIHALGASNLARVNSLSLTEGFLLGSAPFLPGDLVKAVAAAFLGRAVRRALDAAPGLGSPAR